MINIIDYILALLYTVILTQIFTALVIHILAHGIIRKRQGLRNKRFIQIYRYLDKEYKPSIASIYYHVIFLVRRSCIVISIPLFRNNVYAQTIFCSLACVGVLAHMVIVKPFKDRVYNVSITLIELSITVCFSATAGFVSSGIDEEIFIWGMLASIYFSYLLHCFISYYKIMKLVCPKINRWIQESRHGISSI